MNDETVAILSLEKDDRIDEIQKGYAAALKNESGYLKLAAEKRATVDEVLNTLATMRFESAEGFLAVAESLLTPSVPELKAYLGIALDNAKAALPKVQGVLVIYAGGTIGSAPKDPADPDSPQVVKPWRELKLTAPKLSALGYPVDAISFAEPLDSCNVGPRHWRTMAHIIRDHYAEYAGFVILHGTDTMAYSSSALALMLQELAKPVVITGSQISGIVNARNDAHQNMVTAIMLANPLPHKLPLIPEVIAAFGNRIIRGCRNKKMDVTGYQGFDSPNMVLLGEAGDRFVINRAVVRKASLLPLQVLDKMDTHVITVEVFPGMQDSTVLARILDDPELKGVVVKAYGAGNIPTNPEFLNLFRDFVKKGGVVVVVTGVPAGEVEMGLYETSQVLVDRGLIGGFDLTAEAALCKLMLLLGTYPGDTATVKRLMQQSLVGEQSLSLESMLYPGPGTVAGDTRAALPAVELASSEDAERISRVMLRFENATLDTGSADSAKIVLSLSTGEPLGSFKRERVPAQALVKDEETGESLAIDLTRHKDLFVAKAAGGRMGTRQTLGFQIGLEGEGASFAWSGAELNIYVQD